SEVGNTIEEFASGDATVVVGTVIDPEMNNELRVTVVATGLGMAGLKEVKPAPTKVVIDNTRRSNGQIDYSALDRPAHLRASARSSTTATAPVTEKEHEDYLDIPAFLRRQA